MDKLAEDSDEDLDWLQPGSKFEDVAAGWIKAGASIAVLTSGGRGALALSRQGTLAVAAQKAVVVDTVGAGDTFNAGLLAGLRRAGVLTKPALRNLEAASLRPAMELAAKAAAVTVARAGANPPFASELGL